jgi:hypothetical protein
MTIREISTAEVGNLVREMAEEAESATREAVEASILEVTRAAENARTTSRQAIAQAEAVSNSVRVMAEEVMRTATEAAEAARAMSEQAISRAEEFSRLAKERLEKAAIAAEQSSDLAIKEAREAGDATRAALRQAVIRSEEINQLAKEMAEEATRSAREAVESATRAFHESLSKSIKRSEEAKRLSDFEENRVKEVEGARDVKGKVIDFQEWERETMKARNRSIPGAVRTEPSNVVEEAASQEGNPEKHLDGEKTLPKTEPLRRAPWISAIGNSLKKSQNKNREPEEAQNPKDKASGLESGRPAAIMTEEAIKEIFKGLVRIGISSGSSPEKLGDFENQLRDMENLKVLWICGSEDEGTSIVVSLQKPMALIYILNQFSAVERIGKEGETITVELKR